MTGPQIYERKFHPKGGAPNLFLVMINLKKLHITLKKPQFHKKCIKKASHLLKKPQFL
jgi:hypothetical protein